jgi:nucleotide-binding universal stress UspA family protein
VLVPYLGRQHDRAALELARRIAENAGARVTVLRVVTGGPSVVSAADASFDDAAGVQSALAIKVVETDSPLEAVIAESATGYDLVIVGLGEQWGLEHRSIGIRTEAILQRASSSVLVVKAAEGAAAVHALSAAERGRVEPAAAVR